MATIWKLLALFAVLLAPFGMAPAAAATTQHHAMPMQHCPEQAPKHHSGAFGECTMACAAALPAIGASQEEALPIARVQVEARPVRQLHGLHPETATPPPKLS